ncbi:MAG TPA: phasin family protein, partial [Motiliproteus sp.]
AEMNRKVLEQLTSTQSEYLADCLNTSIQQVRELAGVKDASRAAELQFKYLKEFEQKLSQTAEKNMAAFNTLKDGVSKLLTESYADSLTKMEELSVLAESVTKTTAAAPAAKPAAKPAVKKAPARAAAKKAAPAPKAAATKAPAKKAAPAPAVKPAAKPAEAVKPIATPKAAAKPIAPIAPAPKPAAPAAEKKEASEPSSN